MFLEKISLFNYKNWHESTIELSAKINCFVGLNGSGKTNLLDAVFYLSFCKSRFSITESNNILHGQEAAGVKGVYNFGERNETVSCAVSRAGKKRIKRNENIYAKFSDHIGLIPLVMVSPDDSTLVTEGSEERRKYMNSVISIIDRNYLTDTINYNRVLLQRNTLLKTFAEKRYFSKETLELYDEQLSVLGTRIYNARIRFIEQLVPVFEKYYVEIARSAEKPNLLYISQLAEKPMNEQLAENHKKCREAEFTTIGIHKDDLELHLGNFPIKKFGSQGQQKTYLLALKLAQFEFLKSFFGYKPILLLDDVFDKLDKERVKALIGMVSDNRFGQIFVSDTGEDRIRELLSELSGSNKIFYVENGTVINEETV
ncbi:MAG TPA: DNA replication and repair protein RecF [Bacteroidales bacterium]|nr:DNA replication and repair protein RecF [Bacteroidales bacterium]